MGRGKRVVAKNILPPLIVGERKRESSHEEHPLPRLIKKEESGHEKHPLPRLSVGGKIEFAEICS